MKHYSVASGPGVRAHAQRLESSDCGVLWLADGNERDPRWSEVACQTIAAYLETADIASRDLGEIISDIDREVLPAAAARGGVLGLAVSLSVARISERYVTLAFVGEIRSYVMDPDLTFAFVSREHNVFNRYPESAWRRDYDEKSAQLTILDVVGGGTATVEVRVLPRREHGSLISVWHLWHRYATDGADLEAVKALVSNPGAVRRARAKRWRFFRGSVQSPCGCGWCSRTTTKTSKLWPRWCVWVLPCHVADSRRLVDARIDNPDYIILGGLALVLLLAVPAPLRNSSDPDLRSNAFRDGVIGGLEHASCGQAP